MDFLDFKGNNPSETQNMKILFYSLDVRKLVQVSLLLVGTDRNVFMGMNKFLKI